MVDRHNDLVLTVLWLLCRCCCCPVVVVVALSLWLHTHIVQQLTCMHSPAIVSSWLIVVVASLRCFGGCCRKAFFVVGSCGVSVVSDKCGCCCCFVVVSVETTIEISPRSRRYHVDITRDGREILKVSCRLALTGYNW